MENLQEKFDPRLDGDLLYELYEGDAEQAALIFEQFSNTSPALIQEIDNSFRIGDIEGFRKRVHKMKPVFSYVGLSRLTGISEVIERRCKEITEISEVMLLYGELRQKYDEGFAIIKGELKRLDGQIL